MTPNQQEEMEKKFQNHSYVTYFNFPLSKNESGKYSDPETFLLFRGWEMAYSLQQEKIENLEAHVQHHHDLRIKELSMMNDLNSEVSKLKKELAQQKFNNAHNLSIDQQIADKIEKLEKEKIQAIAICKSQFDIVKMERDRLKKFCDEFVYGEENPLYYKTMDEKIESLESDLDWACRGLGFYLHNGSEMDKLQDVVKRHNLDKSEEAK